MANYPERCYLNGRMVPPEEAKVSAFDRGFVFADGVYEVIPVYGGRPFRLAQHLARLRASLAAIGIADPLGEAGWERVIAGLVGSGDESVYLQVTRGPAPRDHAFPKEIQPTVFAYAQALATPDADTLRRGVSAITRPDIRWERCDIKAIGLLANVMLRQQAVEQGAVETILLRQGLLTEGSASNIFVVTDGVVRTPPKGPFILPGVTRDLVVELCQRHQIPVAEASIPEAELRAAEEIWLTSSTKEALPIVRLDGRPVGRGQPGPRHAEVLARYQEYKRALRAGRAD